MTTLAPFVQIVARGTGRARTLTVDEARAAMEVILSGTTAPEAIGALLMVLRLRGETADEIAGFTAALRAYVAADLPRADLDWPCYAAGRTRGAPLFLLAARLVGQAGYRVSMHGWNSEQQSTGTVRDYLGRLRITTCTRAPVCYAPLETLCPEAYRLLRLRDVLGLRSCINTVLRMWNPSGAPATVQGVFHPSYRSLQANAAEVLGQLTMTIIKGGGCEFERHPGKTVEIFGLREGKHIKAIAPALINETRKLHDPDHLIDLRDFWLGRQSDAFARATVIGTAGLALWTVGATPDITAADRLATRLWDVRLTHESLYA